VSTTTAIMPDITCPSWCTTGHRHLNEFTMTGDVWHETTVSGAEANVRVVVDQFVINEGEPKVEAPKVGIVSGSQSMTVDDAIRLAADLVRAAAIIQEASDGEVPA
jgi:hypothetical protein